MKKRFLLRAVAIGAALLAVTNAPVFANNHLPPSPNQNGAALLSMVPLPLPAAPDANGCYTCSSSSVYYTGNGEASAKCCFDVTALVITANSISKRPCANTNNGEWTVSFRGATGFTFSTDKGTATGTLVTAASAANNWVHTYRVTGIHYNATRLIIKDTGGYPDPDEVSVAITPNPYVPVASTITNAGQTACSGAAITPMVITGTAPTGGSFTYSWTAATNTNITGPGSGSSASVTGAFTNKTTATQTVTVTRTVQFTDPDAQVCSGSATAVLYVRPPFTPGAINTTGQTLCAGAVYNAIASATAASGGNGVITYRWLCNGTEIASTNSANYTPTQAGTYTRQAHDGTCNTGWANSTGSWVVTVNALPTFTSIAAAPATICAGGTTTLTITATGAASYSFDNGSSWQTGNTKAVSPAGNATYTANVRSAASCVAAVKTVVVSVISDPTVSVTAAQTICYNTAGSALTATVSGGNGSNTFKWQYSADNSTWSDASGTANTLATGNLTANRYYRAMVTQSTSGCTSTYSASVLKTVRSPFTPGAITSATYASCNNAAGTATTEATPAGGGSTPYSYRWVMSGTSSFTYPTNAATFTPAAMTTPGTYYYVRQVQDACNTAAWSNSTGTVTRMVYPAVSQTATMPSSTICSGASATLNVAAATGGNGAYTYTWQKSTDNVTWSTAPGITNNQATYTTESLPNTTSAAMPVYYRRVAVSCNTSHTTTAGVVTVRPQFTAGTIASTGQTFCSGGTPAAITSTAAAAGGDNNISYQWYRNGVSVGTSGTAAAYTPPLSDGTTTAGVTYTYTRKAKDGTCQTTEAASAGTWVLKVSKLPTAPTPPSGGTVTMCGDGTVSLTATGAGTGESYVWYDGSQGHVGNGNPYQTGVLTPPSTHTFHVAITNNSCTSTLVPVTVIVNESDLSEPTAIDAERCGSGPVTVKVTGDDMKPGEIYTWYTADGATQLGTGTSYTTPSLSVTTSYRLAVSKPGSCSVTPALGVLVTATINPLPIAPAISPVERCGAGTVSLSVMNAGAQANVVYKWYSTSSGGSPVHTGDTYVPNISNSQTYYVEAANTLTNCVSASRGRATAMVHSVPSAAGVQQAIVSDCGPGTLMLTATGAGNGETYRWFDSATGGTELATGSIHQITFNTAPATTVVYIEKYITATGCVAATRTPATATVFAIPSVPNAPVPSVAALCAGETLTFTVTGGSGTYDWSGGGTPNAATDSYTFANATAGVKNVTVRSLTVHDNGLGGNLTCYSGTISASATVVAKPEVPILMSLTYATTACDSLECTVANTTGATSFQWYKGANPIPGATASTYKVKESAIYFAEGILESAGITCTGPKNTTGMPVTIITTPGMPTLSGAADGCDQVVLTAAAAGTTSTTTYSWYRDGVLQHTGTANTYAATYTGAANYWVTAGNGTCTSVASNTHTVIITQTPTLAPTLAAGASVSVCNEAVTVVANELNPSYTYQWYKDNAPVAGETSLTYTIPATETGAHSYSIIAVNGACTGTVKSANKVVRITAAAPAVPSITGIDGKLCGGPVVISASSPTGTTHYTWSMDGAAQSGTASTYSTSALNAHTYTVTAWAYACQSTQSATTVVDITPSTVTEQINFIIPNGNVSQCGGEVEMMSSAGTATPNLSHYEWYRNGEVIQGAQSRNYTATESGIYTVSVVAGNCAGPQQPDGLKKTVVITPVPAVPVFDNPQTVTTCFDEELSLTVAEVQHATRYEWYKNGAVITGATATTYTLPVNTGTVTVSDTYTVKAYNYDGFNTCSGPISTEKAVTVMPEVSLQVAPLHSSIATGKALRTPITIAPGFDTGTGTFQFEWHMTKPDDTELLTDIPATGTTSPIEGGFTFTNPDYDITDKPVSFAVTATYTLNGKTCVSAAATTATVIVKNSGDAAEPEVQTICTGSPATITIVPMSGEENTPHYYDWTRSALPSGVTTTARASASSYLGDPIIGTYNNTTNAPQEIVYTFTPYYNYGDGYEKQDEFTATVVVMPRVSASVTTGLSRQTICSGSTITPITFGTSLDEDKGTVSYTWVMDDVDGLLAGTSTGTGTITGDFTNTTARPQTARYVITPHYSANGTTCSGASFSASVVVQPVATVTPELVINGTIACANTPLSLRAEQPMPGVVSEWRFTGDNGVSVSPTEGRLPATLSFTNSNTWQASGVITVIPKYGTCEGVSVTVPVTINPTITIQQDDINHTLCYGDTDGSVQVSATGGIGALSYTLGGTRNNSGLFTGLGAGVYAVAATDESGCRATLNVTINGPTLPLNSSVADIYHVCSGTGGSITVSAEGTGTAPYRYELFNEAGDPLGDNDTGEFTDLSVGSYTVRTTDANLCTSSELLSFEIGGGPECGGVTIIPAVTAVSCANEASGSIALSAMGGNGNYLYSMDAGNPYSWKQEPLFTGLQAGSYTVYAKDASGQMASVAVVIDNALPIQVSASYTLNHEIQVTAAGGTGMYRYSINGQDWQTQPVFAQPAAGNNVIYVKDDNGCENNALTVVVPDTGVSGQEIGFTVEVQGAANCSYAQKTIHVTNITGGTPDYTYTLNNGNTWNPVTGNSFTQAVAAGTHQLQIKDANDTESAVHTVAVTLENIGAITVATAVTAACHGTDNGMITVSAGGGSGILQYTVDGVNYTPTGNFSGLTARDYTVSVRDANGCSVTEQVTVNSSAPVKLEATGVTNATNQLVADGSVALTAAGGNGDFRYSQQATTGYQSGSQFADLSGGYYTFYAKDGNGCMGSVAVSVGYNEPAPGSISLTAEITKTVSCAASADGEVTVKAFTDKAVKYSKDNAVWQDTPVFGGLSAGDYVFYVRDEATQATGSIQISLSAPAPLVVTPVLTTPLSAADADDAVVTVTATGGTGNLSYARDNGSFVSSGVFGELSQSAYTFTAKDFNGCTGEGYIIIGAPGNTNTNPATPATPTIAATVIQPLTCSQPAKVLVTAAGLDTDSYTFSMNGTVYNGTASYTFEIPTAGTYDFNTGADGAAVTSETLTIIIPEATTGNFEIAVASSQTVSCYGESNASVTLQEATGGSGTNYWYRISGGVWGTSRVFNNLSAGTYIFEAKDEKGCVATVQETVVITESATKLQVSAMVSKPLPDAEIELTATNGTVPYYYSKDALAWTDASNTLTGYTAAGSYLVYVKDENGCTASAQAVINDGTQQLNIAVSQLTPVTCYGGYDGAVTFNVTNGTPAYQVSKNRIDWQAATAPVTGLPAGEHTFYAKDADGKTADITVNIPQPEKLVLAASLVSLDLNGTAAVKVQVTGGTPAYYYSSDNTAFGTGNVLPDCRSGLQTVYVKDLNNTGCLAYTTINIPASADDIAVSAYVSKDITCEGLADAEITVLAGNGTPAYQYSKTGEDGSWIAGNVLSGFTPGVHRVYVRDANGRTAYTLATVQAPTPLRIAAHAQAPTTADATDALIAIEVLQGIAPFSYSKFSNSGWQPSNVLNGYAAGPYTVYAKDANNCPAVSASGVINTSSGGGTPDGLTAFAGVWQQVSCYNADDGIIYLTATGGTATGNYSYSLNGGNYVNFSNGSNHQLSGLAAGTYAILIKKGSDEIIATPITLVITQPDALTLSAAPVDAGCYGYDNGQVLLTATGGTGYKEYAINGAEWTDANTFTHLSAGVRTAYVRDVRGCVATQSVTIGQPAALAFTTSVMGDKVTVENVTGGKSPYRYSKDAAAWETTAVLENIAEGSFTVYVQDANNCVASRSGYLNSGTEANDFSAVAAVTKPLTCGDSNDAEVTVTTVSSGVEYSKDGENYAANPVLTGFPAGIHTVYAKLGDNVAALTVEVLPVTPVRIASVAVIPQITAVNATATVNVTAVGGMAPYSYSKDATVWEASNLLSGYSAGTYNVHVKDNNGCATSAPVVVSSSYTDGSAAISISANISQALKCYGGSDAQITVTATGGSGAYQYTAGDTWITGNGVQVFTGLAAGTYTVKVRDAQDFAKEVTTEVTIAEPAEWTPVVAVMQEVACYGAATGKIEVTSPAGVLFSKDRQNWTSISVLSGFTAGKHTVFVKDVYGCIKTATATVAQPVSPLVITGAEVSKAIDQPGGAEITVTATGGTPAYTYAVAGIGMPGSSNILSDVQPAGEYTVIVTDAQSCTARTIVTVAESNANPDAITSVSAQVTVAPKCYGDRTGEMEIRVKGGIAPYTYDNGIDQFVSNEVVHTFSSLAAGIYTVTVTDAQGSTLYKLVEVAAPAPLTVTAWGSASGLITASAQGGTPQYRYATDNLHFVSSNLIANLPLGTYYVYAADANDCKARTQTPVEIIDNTYPNEDNFSIKAEITVAATPANGNKATVTLTVMDGRGMFVYAKENTESSYGAANVFTGLAPGDYTFYVKSVSSGKVKQVTITIPAVSPLTLNVRKVTPITAVGAKDGVISLQAAGGKAPYRYAKNGESEQESFVFTGLEEGTYRMQVTDVYGSTATVTVTLGTADVLNPSVRAQGNVTCYGGSDGWVEIYVTGGEGDYRYSPDNYTWQTSRRVTGLAAGVHTLYVKDKAGNTAQTTVLITQPVRLQLSAAVVSPVDPTGSNTAVVRLSARGGTPAYHYADAHKAWDTKSDWGGLAAGYHTLYVQDANRCEATAMVNIGEGPAAVSLSAVVTKPLNCFGTADAEVTLTATGGTAPYYYSKDGQTWMASGVLKGFTAGIHTVYVKDTEGSVMTATVTVEQPLQMSAVAIVSKPAPNGEVIFIPKGGAAPYEYSANGTDWQAANALPVSAGTHVFYVRDANGCAVTTSAVSVGEEPAVPPGTTTVSFTAYVSGAVNCYGESTGEITVVARDGNGTFDVSLNNTWSNGISLPKVYTGLKAGTYTVAVRSGGQTATAVQVVISQPQAAVSATAAVTDIACYGANTGSVVLTADGGTAPYLYSRMGYNAVENNVISGLSAGTHVFFVRDAAGCQGTVTASVKQPASRLAVTANVLQAVTAAGGNAKVTATATGGTPGTIGYHYSKTGLTWNYGTAPNETYTLTGYEAGAQKVYVRDANDCIAEASLFISDNSGGSTATTDLSLSAATTRPVSCFGKSDAQITAAAYGGTAPYQYSKDGVNYVSGEVLGGFPAGEHRIYVKDADGQVAYAAVTVNTVQPVTGYAVVTPLTAGNQAMITVIAAGGAGDYTYNITPNANHTGNLFTPVSAGSYVVSLKDANGCEAAPVYVRVSDDPNGVNLTAGVTTPLACADGATAAITVFATGGTAPYAFNRNGGVFAAGSSSFTHAHLAAGTYALQAKDAGDKLSNTLSVPVTAGTTEALAITGVTAQLNSCYNADNGMLTISATGGLPALQYSVDGSRYQVSNVFTAQQLQQGTRYVYVKDALGCEKQGVAVIAATPEQLQLQIIALTPPTAAAPNAGAIVAEAAGGTPAYTYTVGDTRQPGNGTFGNLSADTYVVKVTDMQQCADDETVVLGQSPEQLSVHVQTQDPTCFGSTNGSIAAVVSGGTAPYSYRLDGTEYQPSNVFAGLPAGTYTLYAKDAQASAATAAITVVLTQPDELKVNASVITAPSAGGSNDMKVLATATGGQAPYRYEMAGYYNTTGLFNNLGSGSYLVVARDDRQCEATTTLWAGHGTGAPHITLEVVRQPLCADAQNGMVKVSVTGGEAPYQYSSDYIAWLESNVLSRLGGGQQTIFVKEANGRITAVPVTLQAPAPLSLQVVAGSIKAATGSTATDGAFSLKAIGGTPAYRYSIDDMNYHYPATIEGLSANTYIAYVADANGCRAWVPVQVNDASAGVSVPCTIAAWAEVGTPVACSNNTHVEATIVVHVQDVSGSYTYSKDNFATQQPGNVLTGFDAGEHTVYVKNAAGCTASFPVTVRPAVALQAAAFVTSRLSSATATDGEFTIMAIGGAGSYTYAMNGGAFQSGPTFGGLGEGTYTFTVSDAGNCTATVEGILTEVDILLSASAVEVTENEDPAYYTVRLSHQPTATVGLIREIATPDMITATPETMNYTATDWNTRQLVTVTAIDNQLTDGTRSNRIVTAVATTDDPRYRDIERRVLVLAHDDDYKDCARFKRRAAFTVNGNVTHEKLLEQCRAAHEQFVLGVNGGVTFAWTVATAGGNYPSSESALTLTQNGTYSVTVTDRYGCVAELDNFVVNLVQAPAKPSITGPATPVYGEVTQYLVTPEEGIQYSWTHPTDWTAVGAGVDNTPVLEVKTGYQNGNICVTAADPTGVCTLTETECKGVVPQQGNNNVKIKIYPTILGTDDENKVTIEPTGADITDIVVVDVLSKIQGYSVAHLPILDGQQAEIVLQKIAAGHYFFIITTSTGETFVETILKQ